MRILLVSEGTHEGSPDEARPQALQCLVRRVLPADAEYVWRKVQTIGHQNRIKGKGDGHFKLALKAMMKAMRDGFDGLVLVTDADGKRERIAQFEEAQESIRFTIPRALGIAVEEFDAWILADHQALSHVMQRTVGLQPSCESIRHPKESCQEVMTQHGWTDSQSAFYEAVCARAELQVVADRCPRGFAPFLTRLNQLHAALRGTTA